MKLLTKTALGGALLITTGCTQYLVMAPEPRYGGQPHTKPLTSLGGGKATSPHPGIVAAECPDQLAMIRITRDFGQALLSFVSLGFYAPATVHYHCSTPPPPPEGGGIDTGGKGGS